MTNGRRDTNPYLPPQSPLESSASSADRRESLYTPNQILAGVFAGGPLALIYFLHANFRSLRKAQQARQALYYGGALLLVVLGVLPLLPDSFPNSVIPMTLGFIARHIAATQQLRKEAIVPAGFAIHSTWRVVGVSLLAALVFFVGALVVFFGLDALGIIDLPAE